MKKVTGTLSHVLICRQLNSTDSGSEVHVPLSSSSAELRVPGLDAVWKFMDNPPMFFSLCFYYIN